MRAPGDLLHQSVDLFVLGIVLLEAFLAAKDIANAVLHAFWTGQRFGDGVCAAWGGAASACGCGCGCGRHGKLVMLHLIEKE
mmetsp:Transcript_12863/g.20926  ORF Transcript_12863/g.20926 Transcript_12863/m.20926 type:complete len:82 (+) Transcript_12863:1235-1480(+)